MSTYNAFVFLRVSNAGPPSANMTRSEVVEWLSPCINSSLGYYFKISKPGNVYSEAYGMKRARMYASLSIATVSTRRRGVA